MADAAAARGLAVLALPHDAALDGLTGTDCLINFALHPAYRTGPYGEDIDCDLAAARAAARVGAAFIMLSTRRVYGPDVRCNAAENCPAEGDETAYGRNKARSEKAVQAAMSGGAGIFRLSNIFGYEYDPDCPRRSFLGILLTSLKRKNKIYFDMSPATRRDFLPVETCADLLLDRAVRRTTGTYNLGSGVALPCGDLADWIREGYGGGELVCDPDIVHDEFFLNMDKWRSQFPLPMNSGILREYCIDLGRSLKCEKS
ncbi:MAG: NAD(P)-dependent oxidoreductase [Alphaproteobacteria bacterium]|nr:NAD(P)-dependent oxidoreductase [Alphaproteobacteria bacterium]